ncbi:MAG: ATP phosphoribosyltransferase regulatory subunit [Clostridia bacterium]|nr:ATP phosphoribosyltransferase regulatory subunit [Clostridia bacterium]
MEISQSVLKSGERAMFALRGLYSQYGYSRFKMSKFEEYDFYAQSKNFLRSDSIITFTGSGGRLMALRPDVTLSIVKNVKGDPPQPVKVYYNENVYRASSDSHELTEILQTGLECIGDIDLYQSAEVILLAARSLAMIGENYILDLSHMGFLSALLDHANIPETVRTDLLQCIGEKNAHGITALCADAGGKEEDAARIASAAVLYGPIAETLPRLRELSVNDATEEALNELQSIYALLCAAGYGQNICLDFSIVHDMDYYNGIIMSGCIEGIPHAILAGGRYDKLLSRMGKSGGAMGFAVYLDLLERYGEAEKQRDADILLLYGDDTDPEALMQAVRMLCDSGKSVRAQKTVPEGFRYQQLLRMKDRGLEILETND